MPGTSGSTTIRPFVIPTEGRNLLVARAVARRANSRFLNGFAVSE
jgi:hypothetical protein